MEWFKGFLWLRGICVWCCSGTREAVYLLASSADGNWLAAVSGDWEVHVYSLKHFKVQAGLCVELPAVSRGPDTGGGPCGWPRTRGAVLSSCLSAPLHGAHLQLRGDGPRHPPNHQQPFYLLLGPAGGSCARGSPVLLGAGCVPASG